jgi:hypothetical protein
LLSFSLCFPFLFVFLFSLLYFPLYLSLFFILFFLSILSEPYWTNSCGQNLLTSDWSISMLYSVELQCWLWLYPSDDKNSGLRIFPLKTKMRKGMGFSTHAPLALDA